jgi:hypothetical protein
LWLQDSLFQLTEILVASKIFFIIIPGIGFPDVILKKAIVEKRAAK